MHFLGQGYDDNMLPLWGSYRLKYTSPFQIILPFGAAKEGKADIFLLWAIEVTTLVGVFPPKK